MGLELNELMDRSDVFQGRRLRIQVYEVDLNTPPGMSGIQMIVRYLLAAASVEDDSRKRIAEMRAVR